MVRETYSRARRVAHGGRIVLALGRKIGRLGRCHQVLVHDNTRIGWNGHRRPVVVNNDVLHSLESVCKFQTDVRSRRKKKEMDRTSPKRDGDR